MNNTPKFRLSKHLKGPIYRYIDENGNKGSFHFSTSNLTPLTCQQNEENQTFVVIGNNNIQINTLKELDSICNALDNPYKVLDFFYETSSEFLGETDANLYLITLQALKESILELYYSGKKATEINIYEVLDFIIKKQEKIKKAKKDFESKSNSQLDTTNQSQPQ